MLNIPLILQLFVLLNPLSSLPVLFSAYKKRLEVKAIAIGSVGIAFLVAVSIIFIGPILFGVFDITIDSFRIAGGIVLLLLGLETVRETEGEQNVGEIDSLISIIATPLLTGPATISFIAIKAYEISQLELLANVTLAFLLVGIVFYIFSLMLPKINMKLVSITSKVLGLFLTAVAIEMIAAGISALIKASA
ncbi:MAG: MarC family protein [Candidatus Anstonellales archaeon]